MTEQQSLPETLKGLYFFEGVSPAELGLVASVARLTDHQPGTLIFREGEPLADIFVVAGGSVSLELCLPGQGCKRIQTIGPGELLGWSPILDQKPMTATARAVGPTRLVALDAARLLDLFARNPAFGLTLMRRTAQALAARLSATRLKLVGVYRDDVPLYTGREGAD